MENMESLIYEKADGITSKFFKEISSECIQNNPTDSPSFSLRLMIHIAALITAKTAIAGEGFAKVYDLEDVDRFKVESWIETVASDYLKVLNVETPGEAIN